MKLIVGIGNPDTKYDGTRHNLGFSIIDTYAKLKTTTFIKKDRFNSFTAEFSTSDEKILLAKPQSYYNLSGEALRGLIDFYKIVPSDILVIHDELALPFGTIRTRVGGSDAGNNGIKSINQHLGQETARMRIGIWNEKRDQIDDAAFVLGRFSDMEKGKLVTIQTKACEIIDHFIQDSFNTTTFTV
jgi:peptidyl-tRNA hydrolase, PTH1 family